MFKMLKKEDGEDSFALAIYPSSLIRRNIYHSMQSNSKFNADDMLPSHSLSNIPSIYPSGT